MNLLKIIKDIRAEADLASRSGQYDRLNKIADQLEVISAQSDVVQNSRRWEYFNNENFFYIEDDDGYRVGIQKWVEVPQHKSIHGLMEVDVVDCVTGSGKTFQDAIDNALSK